ncbi:MAG: class I SAM-dependent RNA methyltransferase [Proteobacteria bacterium]|nr:class I SAM-dependent RNA methyltransferase [Pseudomonadota bacterium]
MARHPAIPIPADPIELTVEALGGLGDGTGQWQGRAVYVAKACAGDVLCVRITHQNAEGLSADIVEILQPGPARADAPCPYFSRCGGCGLQQLQTPAYREFKTRLLHYAVSQAGYEPQGEVVFLPTATRRRVEFKVLHTPQGVQLAFLAARSHQPVAVESCLVLAPALQALLVPLAQALSQFSGRETITAVSLTQADTGLDLLLTCAKPLPPQAMQPLLDIGIARVSCRVGEKLAVLHTQTPIVMQLGGVSVPMPPGAFLQASREGQAALTQGVLRALENAQNVADLFCGLGTFALPMAQTGKVVHAVEGEGASLASLRGAAKGLSGFSCEQRDLFENPLAPAALSRFDAVVVNPPRAGAKAQMEKIVASRLSRVAMVSCNPATFARDARLLQQAGFRLVFAQGVDQFVYSPHLEIVACFEK